MPTTEFEVALDDEAQEWLRVRIITEGGTVTGFTIQYETTDGNRRVPVARYDSAHGQAHRDLCHRDGRPPDKRPLPPGTTYGQALQIGKDDITANWRRYRARFFEEWP